VLGNCVMAVSALRARLSNHFFFLVCKLYLSPFFSKVVSLLEKCYVCLIYDSGVKSVSFSWCYCLFSN
jgi:hypothetical protein